MVIDGSQTIRKILEVSLRREGIASVSYANGIETLCALSERRHPIPDVVILDIGLPKMDGYEIAHHLRANQLLSHAVIIMLSSRDGVLARLKGHLVGAKAHVTKPFRTQEIMSVVQSYLRKSSYEEEIHISGAPQLQRCLMLDHPRVETYF